MTTDEIIEAIKVILPPEQWQAFSERALWAAAESQKPTAIPALTVVAALSLELVIASLAVVAFMVRRWRGSE